MNVAFKKQKNSPRSGRLYQRVAEQLAAVIAEGEYPLGSRLPAERKLAERFDVSRPTVREAIIALELAGCVEVRGGSGVYVCDANSNNFPKTELAVGPFDILEARILVEGQVAELAAERITNDELKELREALTDMVQENEKEPICEEADQNFHLLIARSTRNEALVSACAHLWSLRNSSPVSARILQQVRQVGSRPRIEEHRAILEALESRDPKAARKAMRKHLTCVIQQLLEASAAEAMEETKRKIASDKKRFGIENNT